MPLAAVMIAVILVTTAQPRAQPRALPAELPGAAGADGAGHSGGSTAATGSPGVASASAADDGPEDEDNKGPEDEDNKGPEDEDDDGDRGGGDDDGEARPPPEDAIAYETEIVGGETEGLSDTLRQSAQLITLADSPPSSLAGLARRIKGDLNRLETVLRSEGFWDGTVTADVNRDADPILVRLTVEPGPAYTFAAYRIHFVGDSPPPDPPPLEELGIVLGERARGAEIVTAGRLLLEHLRNHERPLATRTDRRIVVDHGSQSVEVDVYIDPGPAAAFGTVSIEGLETVNESYVRQWITWEVGDPYDERITEAFRSDLLGTALFASVALDLSETVQPDGTLPMTVRIVEAKHRSVGAAISYGTDRGPGGRLFWRHRNLLGNDEDFEIALGGDLLEQSAEISLVRPNWNRRDRRLFSRARVTNSDTDAFAGLQATATVGLAWPLAENWEASVALAAEYSDLTDNLGDQESWLVGVPSFVQYDGANDDLDPTEGARFRIQVTPTTGNSGKAITFVSTVFDSAAYYPFDEAHKYVLAGRLNVGMIFGEETLDIPANRRLYAGGGGSIRGFGFQKVGPLTPGTDDPIGGRSRIEVSTEMRVRVWGDIGVVAFVDGGQVFDSSVPDFSNAFRWAAGFGVRYHTPVGPLRFDLGFPINRRPGIDDIVQFYISLGQAF